MAVQNGDEPMASKKSPTKQIHVLDKSQKVLPDKFWKSCLSPNWLVTCTSLRKASHKLKFFKYEENTDRQNLEMS